MARQLAVWNAFAHPIRHRGWGILALVVFTALIAQPARFAADGSGRPFADAQPAAVPDVGAASRNAPAMRRDSDQSDVEAVVALAARKYRVAEQVVREFVTAAFAEARRNRLDPLLVVAVIGIESRFNPIAQSDFGATGLMQIIPRFHRDKFSPAKGETVLDPRTNIRVGTRALKEYVALGGTESAGLQLYNGSANDPERGYARKVLAERARLREAIRRMRGRSASNDT